MILILLVCMMFTEDTSSTVENYAATSYIEKYQELAVLEMHRSGVPASVTLAQALIETNAGQSSLAVEANNHFGIKCKRTWNGDTYYHKDDDFNKSGQLIESCFRSYDSAMDSYIDHSNFLRSKENYLSLFLLDRYDYKNWAEGLKRAGYATNPQYAQMIISKIEQYGLDQYDRYPNPIDRLKNN